MQTTFRFLAALTIFLVSFFFLINNINYLKSILNNQNSDLSIQNQALLTNLETKNNRNNNSFNLEIDKKSKSGDIALINPANQIGILTLKKSDAPLDASTINQKPNYTGTAGTGLISR
jgi:histidyl-tRNA synthetase